MKINMPCKTKRTLQKTQTYSTEEIKKQLEQLKKIRCKDKKNRN